MKILALIPARMGSTRFPGKPMATICGQPMIGHVYKRVRSAKIVNLTAVATCDKIIYNYICSIGGAAIMTSKLHTRATDRCAEALLTLEKQIKKKFNIVVMVQGDEPMVDSNMIFQAIKPLISNKKLKVTNLLGKIKNDQEYHDHNCIKAVCDLKGNALYFSRAPIPATLKSGYFAQGKQICIIGFQRDFLIQYTKFLPTPLEKAESIDMLRILENGIKIKMIKTNKITQSVDTPNDLKKVRKIIK